MGNYCQINGISFDVNVSITDYEENFNVLDGEGAGRTIAGTMVRDIIGCYVGHKITFRRKGTQTAIDTLWDYLVAHSVDDSVLLTAADDQSIISYRAYYTSGKRKLVNVEGGVNRWDEIEVNFIPISPTLT